jgi:hypothetical protein
MIYLTAPITWFWVIKDYQRVKDDQNCIKKHGYYMSGNFNCANSDQISMKKAKALSKKMGITMNDMMMGMTSQVLK